MSGIDVEFTYLGSLSYIVTSVTVTLKFSLKWGMRRAKSIQNFLITVELFCVTEVNRATSDAAG